MESAIPLQFRCLRSLPKRSGDDYQPVYPGWSARNPPSTDDVTIACFGVQWLPANLSRAELAVEAIALQLSGPEGSSFVDRAECVDDAGYRTLIQIAYWTDARRYERFLHATRDWWSSDDRETDGVGLFREIFTPRMSHLETLFSSGDHLEGVGSAFGVRSEQAVQEHGYWGSMRDRLPAAQIDLLHPSGRLSTTSLASSKRISVEGHANIAVIRSGQDWSDTSGRERQLYLEKMEPTLRSGMNFLRDEGVEIGCYSNRYFQHVDLEGRAQDRSFGLSYWQSLKDMEVWAEFHPTHKAIFGGFGKMVQTLPDGLDLRLYHEVFVVQPKEQTYEYIACHPSTGMMGAMKRE